MKLEKFWFLFAFCIIPFLGFTQVQPEVKDTIKPVLPPPPVVISPVPHAPDTAIHIYEQPIVTITIQTLYDYQRYSYSHGTSPGFRIQINFGQEKNAIYEARSDFSDKFPGVPSYVTYKQPYFRLSVGDFRTRLDAVRFMNAIKKDYPGAFIVADRIMPPPL